MMVMEIQEETLLSSVGGLTTRMLLVMGATKLTRSKCGRKRRSSKNHLGLYEQKLMLAESCNSTLPRAPSEESSHNARTRRRSMRTRMLLHSLWTVICDIGRWCLLVLLGSFKHLLSFAGTAPSQICHPEDVLTAAKS